MSKVGRPAAQIDPADLGSLANAGLTQIQAAIKLGVSIRTLRAKLAKERALRAAWNDGTERHRKRVAREKSGAKVPGRRPGRPPKIRVEMDPKSELALTARLTEMLVRKAESGSVAAMRVLLDRLMPPRKG